MFDQDPSDQESNDAGASNNRAYNDPTNVTVHSRICWRIELRCEKGFSKTYSLVRVVEVGVVLTNERGSEHDTIACSLGNHNLTGEIVEIVNEVSWARDSVINTVERKGKRHEIGWVVSGVVRALGSWALAVEIIDANSLAIHVRHIRDVGYESVVVFTAQLD